MKNASILLLLFLTISCGYIDIRNKPVTGAFGNLATGRSAKGLSGLFKTFSKSFSKSKFIDKNEVSETDVNRWRTYFLTKSKDRFARYLANGFQYKDIIVKTFKQYDLPEELFYLGIIESGYYTKAKSHAGAHGPWQFMTATGRSYGLKVNSKVDERRSIFKATHAAAKYLKDLHNIFNSWELALAAYNAGENKIIRLIRKAKTRSFYELARKGLLPKETVQYVPKMLAAIELGENWQDHYTVKTREPWKNSDFKTLNIYRKVSVYDLAKALRVDKKKLKEWNADLTSGMTIASLNRPFTLYLHKDVDLKGAGTRISSIKRVKTAQKKKRSIAGVKVKKTPSLHKVRKGENLTLIAKRYRTKVSILKSLNKLNRRGKIRIGQRLKLPEHKSMSAKIYRVRIGDNLTKISRRFKVPIKRLKAFNGLTHSKIYPKQRLRIPSNG